MLFSPDSLKNVGKSNSNQEGKVFSRTHLWFKATTSWAKNKLYH